MKYLISILYVLKEGIKDNLVWVMILIGLLMMIAGVLLLPATLVSGESVGNSNDSLAI